MAGSHGWLKQKGIFSWEMYHHIIACLTYKAGRRGILTLSFLSSDLLLCRCILCCRVSDTAESSGPTKQKPSGTIVLLSPAAAAPNPSPLATVAQGGAGLMACSYANARSSI
jgi:hypothetical protein